MNTEPSFDFKRSSVKGGTSSLSDPMTLLADIVEIKSKDRSLKSKQTAKS